MIHNMEIQVQENLFQATPIHVVEVDKIRGVIEKWGMKFEQQMSMGGGALINLPAKHFVLEYLKDDTYKLYQGDICFKFSKKDIKLIYDKDGK